MKDIINHKYFVPAFLFLWVVLVQLFCNIDSYLYAPCDQNDSTWYFMAGKAWMNDLLPYRDFADSKGLYLWLLYGIAYLIDKYSFIGMFWIVSICIWITLWLSYSTARLWFCRTDSLLMVMTMPILMCYWRFFMETKSEILCWPYVAFGINLLCNQLKGNCTGCVRYVFLGVSIVACMLLKWSTAIMYFSFVVSAIWLQVKYEKRFTALPCVVIGALAAFAPFAIYIIYNGIWEDFVREYFVNTLSTVSVPLSETLQVYGMEWAGFFASRRLVYLFYIISALVMFERKRWFSSLFPALCGLWYLGLALRHDLYHNLWVLAPFSLFFVAVVISRLLRWGVRVPMLLSAIAIAFVVDAWGTVNCHRTFCLKNLNVDKYMAASYAMSTVEHPLVISSTNSGSGFALGDALPATRYWSEQLGVTDAMTKHRIEGIRSCKADFIIMQCEGDSIVNGVNIRSLGYHELCNTGYGIIFTNKDVKMPAEIKPLSPFDIIMKKSYKELYE